MSSSSIVYLPGVVCLLTWMYGVTDQFFCKGLIFISRYIHSACSFYLPNSSFSSFLVSHSLADVCACLVNFDVSIIVLVWESDVTFPAIDFLVAVDKFIRVIDLYFIITLFYYIYIFFLLVNKIASINYWYNKLIIIYFTKKFFLETKINILFMLIKTKDFLIYLMF